MLRSPCLTYFGSILKVQVHMSSQVVEAVEDPTDFFATLCDASAEVNM